MVFMSFPQVISIVQRSTKLPVWLFNSWKFYVFLLQVMYRTFHYLTVSRIPATGHVLVIQYLTVTCVPGTGHVQEHFNTWQFYVYLLQDMYRTFQYLTVSCIPATGHVQEHFNTWQFHVYLLQVYISSYDGTFCGEYDTLKFILDCI